MNADPLENEEGAAAEHAPAAPAAPAFDPRRRIRELLSIPDRDRTDEEWDELNELEIQTAPGNRSSGQPFANYANPGGGGNKPGGGGKNRFKGKPRKPGPGGGGNRPPHQGKPNKPPRPA
jgi:hypothetical protein